MRIAGIVCEYNPFHNGHLYQIEETKKMLGVDGIVAVMSGNFTMRGSPALYNKYIRAKAATLNGVDLVLELSTPYALSSSEYFSYGAVSLLDKLNIIDYLSFGSEAGDIKKLSLIADKLLREETIIKIKENQKRGIPVFQAISDEFTGEDKEILSLPNNILGINYIKALKKLDSKIEPYTIKRMKVGYNDILSSGNIASATAIREYLKEDKNINKYIPENTCDLYNTNPVFDKEYDKLITYAIRVKSAKDLRNYPDVTEGLENLIKESGEKYSSVYEIADNIKSKRYTYTRIKRILYNILLDITKEKREKEVEFARVLAFSEKGKEILKNINEKSDIEVFTNPKKESYEKYEFLNIDKKSSLIYDLSCKNNSHNSDRILI